MARLDRLRVYPVKGLDGIEVDAADVLGGGTLEHDREFALFDADGDVLNGKRTDRVHDLSTDFDPDSGAFAVETPAGETEEFVLSEERERERAEAWFCDFFDRDLTLERDAERGYVDRREMGLSVLSSGTLAEIASWFDDLGVGSVRRRLRANVEVADVPAFWEDRFVSADAPGFRVGEVRFEGLDPCGRCVVPARDPDTGDELSGFRERFIRQREATFPAWADEDAFDHFYTAMILARPFDADRGRRLRVGDAVAVMDE
ncbi:MOSC domain-containing protein [Halobellus rubicundus]|uniref:MOSC domain-containing protein n=1 Tax=Halobellus rubicundus TaxID=2996466 RepID=A0ABD5MGM3_9EURY